MPGFRIKHKKYKCQLYITLAASSQNLGRLNNSFQKFCLLVVCGAPYIEAIFFQAHRSTQMSIAFQMFTTPNTLILNMFLALKHRNKTI